jgi:NAD(P)-dependent dehydrogenase (short-subunit alcohol dehydrogenase family)
MSVQFSFAGQVALVTGGATGLGLAIATAFGRAGAIVATHDLTRERTEAASTSRSPTPVSTPTPPSSTSPKKSGGA